MAKITKEQLLIIAKSDNSQFVLGALGDLEGCNAYIEEFKLDGENGYLTKYFGVKTPYKGWIDPVRIDKVTITKKAFKEIIKLWPLRIGRITESFLNIYDCDGGLSQHRLRDEEFCPAVRELIRASGKTDMSYCFGMFLQFSPTYRLLLQDIFGEIDKESFEKHPLTEILRLKRIFMGRLQGDQKKLEFLCRLVFLAVLFNKKKARKFVEELNIEKLKIDNKDRYYCLRRSSYNFFGLSLEERLREAEERDKKEGNILLGI
jgi:hypothetical protein